MMENEIFMALKELLMPLIGAIAGIIIGSYQRNSDRDYQKFKEEQERDRELMCLQFESIKKAVLEMLGNNIINDYQRIMERGDFIYIIELTSLRELYVAYKELGGNGTVDHIMTQLRDLEVRNIPER